METVFATKGGSRFHKTTICESAERARLIYDSDEFTVRSNPWESTTLTDAMGSGKEACATCFPGLRAAWYRSGSEDDFGHWPTRGISLDSLAADVCQRCTEPGVLFSRGNDDSSPVYIAWPCTSAIILGLVPREVAA